MIIFLHIYTYLIKVFMYVSINYIHKSGMGRYILENISSIQNL